LSVLDTMGPGRAGARRSKPDSLGPVQRSGYLKSSASTAAQGHRDQKQQASNRAHQEASDDGNHTFAYIRLPTAQPVKIWPVSIALSYG